MAARRFDILQATLNKLAEKVDEITSKRVVTVVSSNPHAEACNSMIAGSMIRALSRENLFPVPAPGLVLVSLARFEKQLRTAVLSCQKDWAYLTDPQVPGVHWANEFVVWQDGLIHDLTTKTVEGCMQGHYNHLKAQAALSGIEQGLKLGAGNDDKQGDGKCGVGRRGDVELG